MIRKDEAIEIVVWFLAALIVLSTWLFVRPAFPQQLHSHNLYHAQYQNWQSNAGFSCCNDKDCRALDESSVRELNGAIEVFIADPQGDEWCPVTWGHLVSQLAGKRPSPDWTVNHACILEAMPGRKPCERFKCFMGKAVI